MLDLTEPRAIEPGAAPAAPKTAVRLASSEASPTRVEVPWASTAPRCGGVHPGALPGALDREPLAHGVGRGDALALAVGGAADAEDDGVDTVPVSLGVLEPLEDEQGGAFAHDEAVGAGVERSGACRRERTDLAELHERVHAHVAIQPAGDDGVELVVGESGDGGVERGQARGAGGIGGEVHPTQVEQVRDPAGDDVRELAGHGVLGDREDVVEVAARVSSMIRSAGVGGSVASVADCSSRRASPGTGSACSTGSASRRPGRCPG